MTTRPSLPHRARRFALVALALAACGGDAGLVVEVTRERATTPPGIDRLEFSIGVGYRDDAFRQEGEPITTVELAAGRDLAVDPYRLLLEPANAAGEAPPVMVAVLGYDGDEVVGFGRLEEPVEFAADDLRQWTVVLRGDGEFRLGETGCLWIDDFVISARDDLDCDGDRTPVDCDDQNPDVGPSSQERCANQIDDNCNDQIDEEVDLDDDGVSNCDDCDDGEDRVYPGAEEVCDGLDNDCSGVCDGLFDRDGDNLTTCGSKRFANGAKCEPPRDELIDCNDGDDQISPLADEICDGKDNDCNQICDDGFDGDGDGFTECGSVVGVCADLDPGLVDCEPEDGEVFPGAAEICDGKDNNCDGEPFGETAPCYASVGDTNLCVLGERRCIDTGGTGLSGPCETDDRADRPEFQVPNELCEAYEVCETMGEPDPFSCANDKVREDTASCMVFYDQPDESDLCPNASNRIEAPDKPGCRWTVLGGADQAHYRVGFAEVVGGSPSDTVTADINACNVFFVVEEARDQPPERDEVLLWYRSGLTGDTRLISVELAPVFDPICPARGLRCPDLLPGMP